MTDSAGKRTHAACPICGSTRWRLLIRAGDLPHSGPVQECRDCDLVFFQDMGYDADYWGRQEHFEVYEASATAMAAEYREYLGMLAAARPEKGRLLDVGAGTGAFMKLAAEAGWTVEGVEPGDQAVEKLRKELNAPIHHGFFEHVDLAPASYDCLTMWDVIEHLYEPNAALARAAQVVKPGGLFVFKTPNERSLFKRLPLFLYKITGGRFKSFLKYVYYDPHFYSYSPRCCRNMLARHGFTVDSVRYETTDMTFARKKLDHSYGKFRLSLFAVKLLLPLAVLAAKLSGRQNKLVVIARRTPA